MTFRTLWQAKLTDCICIFPVSTLGELLDTLSMEVVKCSGAVR